MCGESQAAFLRQTWRKAIPTGRFRPEAVLRRHFASGVYVLTLEVTTRTATNKSRANDKLPPAQHNNWLPHRADM